MSAERGYISDGSYDEFYHFMQMQSQSQNTSGYQHINDATAVARIDLKKEQARQMLNRAKVSTSEQNGGQHEGEVLTSRSVLQAKVENIISKHGLTAVGKDVEDCLREGLGVLMHRLISSMIKMSKARVDVEKGGHRIHVTSDIHQQVMTINQAARDHMKLQANIDIADGGEIDKSAKSSAATKENTRETEEDLAQRAARANKRVRESVGGDDIVSKWKMLSKKARQQEDRRKTEVSQEKGSEDRTKQDQPVVVRKRVVTMKDAKAALEKEPQIGRSVFMYCLLLER